MGYHCGAFASAAASDLRRIPLRLLVMNLGCKDWSVQGERRSMVLGGAYRLHRIRFSHGMDDDELSFVVSVQRHYFFLPAVT